MIISQVSYRTNGPLVLWLYSQVCVGPSLNLEDWFSNEGSPIILFPVLASSGIDYDIKIWAPLLEKPSFDQQRANEVKDFN